MASFTDSLPPDLFDKTTLISLASTVVILLAALLLSRLVLDPKSTPKSLRFLFIWHAFDALIHFFLEGSFVYLCLFSSKVVEKGELIKGSLLGEDWSGYYPSPYNYLGSGDNGAVVHGAQAAVESNPFARLWMVYARADRRWAGVDLVCLNFSLSHSLLRVYVLFSCIYWKFSRLTTGLGGKSITCESLYILLDLRQEKNTGTLYSAQVKHRGFR